ncbi:MAG: hypothetical protein JEZ10_05835 [Verrucomicrobia bacterium]|nr:hypothetical protein [Verrucomicrobiota bacterium]
MTRMTVSLLCIGILAATAAAEFGKPEDIPEAGRIRIDGNLSDWRRAEWTPLETTLNGNPANISNARWSLAWDEDAVLYIAVQYDDTEIVLQDSYVNSNAQDGVGIYVRGDTGGDPEDYSTRQDSAQQYTFGLSKNRQVTWKKLGALEPFPTHNPAKAVATLEGNRFTYEIMVPLYDSFDAVNRRKCSETEVFLNEENGVEIGIDIAIVDVGKTGYAGMKAENALTGKRTRAGQIAEHTLSD